MQARLPIYYDEALGTWSSALVRDSVETKMALARRVDALADQLPERKMLTSRTQMIGWALEILPYMSYEGLTEGEAKVPADIGLFWLRGSRAFHLAGTAACRTETGPAFGPVYLNSRYVNPASVRYGYEGALGTLVHELIHMQGGPFCSGLSEDLETNTQIATIEVLAAMVNHGNLAVLRPLLRELRGLLLATLQYELPRADYMAFLATVADDAFEIARQEKSYRFWQRCCPDELQTILRKYNAMPVDALLEGVHDGTVERVQVPSLQTTVIGARIDYQVVYGPLLVDDLAYVLSHADGFVEAAR